MKRKPLPLEPVIDQKILESAKKAIQLDKAVTVRKCTVCDSPCTGNYVEDLCWVCRRLKISAWRDSDQPPIQE